MTDSLAVFVVSGLAIPYEAPRLAGAAERLADLSGLGQTFIGTTALALGNIFGRNAFNMLLFLPPSAEMIALLITGLLWLLYRGRAG